jgi:pyruvate,water dikinase
MPLPWTERNKYVWRFQDCTKEDVACVGGKNANLGEMTQRGIRVPPGFAVTADAYKEALEKSGVDNQIKRILSSVSSRDMNSLEKASLEIRTLFESLDLPKAIEEVIDDYYTGLAERIGVSDPLVAVRSSATAEDLPDASFAGQQDTFLGIRGHADVKKHVIKCWASLFGPRAIDYREKHGFAHDKVYISVGIQKMVNARVAGVSFTLNPISGDPSKIAISATWGLGEALVSGEVTPDEWLVEKFDYEVVKKRMGSKSIQHVLERDGGVAKLEVPSEQQTTFSLTDDELTEVARICRIIEEVYGMAMDIEWAIDRDLQFPDNVFMVQARPETVWAKKRAAVLEKSMSPTEFILDFLKTGKKLT